MLGVHAREPVKKMKQFFCGSQRVSFGDGFSAMNREVTDFLDRLNLQKEISSEVISEGWFVDKCAEIIVIRSFQFRVVFVQPMDGKLKRAPRIEAARARIRKRERFNLRG